MRVVIQRVSRAKVEINGLLKAEIEKGMLVLLGIESADEKTDADWLCAKLSKLRIFSDEAGQMNLDINTIGGSFLVVSQFTLHGNAKKGNRPSFIRAARPEQAIPLYNYFVNMLEELSACTVKTGEFGADMQLTLVNDGPVTLVMDTAENR
ncbi:MAG: D-aminoacyl-tRNA deacylase [Bacteroidales bacterium]|jgi:D-tyrosyl-tRNA(Tyr) deacylase|nr:D-aminoacyl-tRNA deacylase [Bacteroidales bacterium]